MILKSDIAAMPGPTELHEGARRFTSSAIRTAIPPFGAFAGVLSGAEGCHTMSSPRDESRSAEIPSTRAVLAVRRSAGAADRRRARLPRSGSPRGAVRIAAAALLDHAGLPGARRSGLRPRAP